jgi:phospholipid/cholesterol/gamma-HCH transport system substrate-binding protein
VISYHRHIRPHLLHLACLAAMIAISVGVAAYVTVHQRLRFPWQDELQLYAEFDNAQAVTAGQGQTVDVAGVKIGEIGDVQLKEGRAVVRLDITEQDEVGSIYRNATLALRPKTGLNDMAVQMDPGRPDPALPDRGRLSDGDRIPIENTQANLNPDTTLAALDVDTRAYLKALLNAGAGGLRGRGPDLRAVLRASAPTLAHAARVSRALADRRAKVRRLIANLRRLSEAAATKDDELRTLVDSSSAVLRTLGERDSDLQTSTERLPGAIGATRRMLTAVGGLSVDARPALDALRPVARELAPAMVEARPLLRDAAPIVRNDVRPLVRATIPLLTRLRPSLEKVDGVTAPDLLSVARTLDRTVNLLGYNPPGPEEGFLFHAAWYTHNATSVLSVEDAHGVAWRGLVLGSCSSLPTLVQLNPALAPLQQLPLCPMTPGGTTFPPLPKRGTARQWVERSRRLARRLEAGR